MLCYFISKKDLSILNIVELSAYAATLNLDCSGKTKITIADNPNASDEDFVIIKDGKKTKFNGIIESIDNADGEKQYTISCLEIERIFDRKILLSDVELIKTTGIEDFIAAAIRKYFSSSGDSFIDMPYINCAVLTHTKTAAKPDAEDGIFNLKTYIGNTKEKYGIFLDFEFTKTNLNISIHKKEQTAMQIDATITDVLSCKETYKIQVLAKLSVIWHNPTTQEDSLRNFYLHSNRTVSEENKNRIRGKVSTIYIEAETEEEMIQEAKNEFKSNSYMHSIEAEFLESSKLYPPDQLYVGHEVTIKTAAEGIKESIISEISFTHETGVISVKFGVLKVKLTDKLK